VKEETSPTCWKRFPSYLTHRGGASVSYDGNHGASVWLYLTHAVAASY
jgi:hypothetical protein